MKLVEYIIFKDHKMNVKFIKYCSPSFIEKYVHQNKSYFTFCFLNLASLLKPVHCTAYKKIAQLFLGFDNRSIAKEI